MAPLVAASTTGTARDLGPPATSVRRARERTSPELRLSLPTEESRPSQPISSRRGAGSYRLLTRTPDSARLLRPCPPSAADFGWCLVRAGRGRTACLPAARGRAPRLS